MEKNKKEAGTVDEVIREYEKYLNIALKITNNPDIIIEYSESPDLFLLLEDEDLKQVVSVVFSLSMLLKAVDIEVIYTEEEGFKVTQTEKVTYELGFNNIKNNQK